ncbi:MAG TPA: response regulator [Armatimonadota bacterium]|nr:response regulator [Armatimonadota bacterium]
MPRKAVRASGTPREPRSRPDAGEREPEDLARCLLQCCRQLAASRAWPPVADRPLERVARALGADASAVYGVSDEAGDGRSAVLDSQWGGDQGTPIAWPQQLPLPVDSDQRRGILGRVVTGSSAWGDLAELDEPERSAWATLGSGAVLAVPFEVRDRFGGFFAVFSRQAGRVWPEHDILLLELAALASQEIFARRTLAETVRSTEELYRSIAGAVADAAHVVDRRLRIVSVGAGSAEWVRSVGADLGDPVGRHLTEVFPFLPRWVLDEYQRVFDSGETLFTEDLTTVGTREVYTDTWKIPVLEHGKVTRVVTLIRDTTAQHMAEEEQRQLEARIRHAQRLESLEVLAGGVAHDFSNILQVIIGNLALAKATTSDLTVLGYLQQIETAALRASELSNQMLAYSGRGQAEMQPVDLAALVNDMAQLLAASVSRKAQLRCEMGNSLPPVRGDATQLRQVVLNLITNAAEALEGGEGCITVRARAVERGSPCLRGAYLSEDVPAGALVCLEVSDTGRGMDRATRERIFDPFFSTKPTGRGLGLAVVFGVVRGHRGAIKVESRLRRGTTFHVMFPCDGAVEPPAPRTVEPASAADEWTGSGTILVVDDEEGVRKLVKALLELRGFEVLLAGDGRAAVEVFNDRASDIRLVLLDMRMPRMSGEEALDAIRQRRPDVPIIVASGYSEQDATRHLDGLGRAWFIRKPFRLADLETLIKEALAAAES